MKYCCDCVYMDENANKSGLFKCENARKSNYNFVSARMKACLHFCNAWYSKRGEFARNKLMSISKEHGYYIMSALTEILGLDESYCEYFKEFKNYAITYFEEFFNVYDEEGPILKTKLINDPDRLVYAKYLLSSYVDPFVKRVKINNYFDAYLIYVEMFDILLRKYDLDNYVLCKSR